nr:MAG TPA: hypothetical protein [Caudoviricetes sp.]
MCFSSYVAEKKHRKLCGAFLLLLSMILASLWL